MPAFLKEHLSHKAVRIAFVAVGVILVGSIAYYLVATHVPGFSYVEASMGPVSADVLASGVVSPSENPDLAFTAAGRVTSVRVAVGDTVAEGTVLATLDTGILGANLAAANAERDEIAAGPRAVDLGATTAAVATAQAARDNAYATYPATLADNLANMQSTLALTDPFFKSPNGSVPTLSATYANQYDERIRIQNERAALNGELVAWQDELHALPPTGVDAATAAHLADEATTHLAHLRVYLDDLATAIGHEPTGDDTNRATLAAGLTSVNTARQSATGLGLTLSASAHELTNADLALQSAQASLSKAQAGATPEALAAANAQVSAAAAALRQAEIIAPFAGKVAGVAIREGDLVSANAVGISLVPAGRYEVAVQLSELERAEITAGKHADVTLDAYGAGQVFSGTVATVDAAPIAVAGGTPSYRVTIVLDTDDARIAVGMHANATIAAGRKDQALTVPRTAIIDDGAQAYVLKKSGSTPVKTPVTLGLIGDDSVEVLSGIAVGDRVARIGGQ